MAENEDEKINSFANKYQIDVEILKSIVFPNNNEALEQIREEMKAKEQTSNQEVKENSNFRRNR